MLVSAPGKLRPGDDRPEHAAVRAGAPAGRKPRNTSQSEAIRRTSSRALKGFAFLGMRSSISPGYSPRPRWWPSPIVGRCACPGRAFLYSTQRARAVPRAAACLRVLFALTSHGVLLTLQVESCTSPWLCTLLRSFRLSLPISAVRHPHKCRPSQVIVMQHHTARPRATEAGRRAAARMANPSKNRKLRPTH